MAILVPHHRLTKVLTAVVVLLRKEAHVVHDLQEVVDIAGSMEDRLIEGFFISIK
jgi:hypothetical protein